MATQWRLCAGSLALALIATQPAYALEWELVEDQHNKASTPMPASKAAQAPSDPIDVKSAYVKTGNREEYQPKGQGSYLDGWVEPNQVSASKLDIETIDQLNIPIQVEKEKNQVSTMNSSQADREISVDKMSTINCEKSNSNQVSKDSSLTNRMVVDLSNQAELSLPSNRSNNIPRWELVTNNKESAIPIAQEERREQTYISWELVPSGEEMKAHEVIEEIKAQKELMTKAENKIHRSMHGNSRPSWLRRLFSNNRNEFSRKMKGNEEMLKANDKKIDHNGLLAKSQNAEGNAFSYVVDSLNTVGWLGGKDGDQVSKINREPPVIGESNIPSQLTEPITDADINFTVLSEGMKSREKKEQPTSVGFDETGWRVSRNNTAVPIVKIRF
jgi:hypothetical protein